MSNLIAKLYVFPFKSRTSATGAHMPITLRFCITSPALALLCLLLRLQSMLPAPLRRLGKRRGRRRYSVITAVYNAERWLPDYFRSLFCQTIDVEGCLEIICVDDGSTDGSSKVIRRWQRRYPGVITYIHKKNGGPASARNMGIEKAAGEWVTFTDADDFLHPGYFAAVDACLASVRNNRAGLIVCRYLMYAQASGTYSNTHFLRHQFNKGEQRFPASRTGSFVQVVTNSAFFLRRAFKECNIRQREDVRPTFEDGEMVIRYVLALEKQGLDVCVLPQAKYYHRRAVGTVSLTQQAFHSASYYDAPLELGCLRLLREIREDLGKIPLFAQMTILHSVSRYFQRVLDGNPAFIELADSGKQHFFNLVHDILDFIDPEVIENAILPAAPQAFIALMLGLYKKRDPAVRKVYIECYNAQSHSFSVFFHSRHLRENVCFYFDGQPLAPNYLKATALPIWRQGEFYEHRCWLPLPHLKGVLHSESVNAEFLIASSGRSLGRQAPVRNFIARLSPHGLPTLAWPQALLVRAATSWPIRRLYGRAWMFIENKTKAGGDAEDLYHHVLHNQPKQQAYFVLHRDSPDWARLRAEGFRLIAFGSQRHKVLLLNCERFITSQLERDVTAFLRRDLTRYSLVFLGPGRDDCAIPLNKLPIAFQPMATLQEQEHVTRAGSPFRLTRKEAGLTGLPRFDSLYRLRGRHPKHQILFIPDLRRHFTGISKDSPDEARHICDIESSLYTESILAFLHGERLAALLAYHNHHLALLIHPGMRQYFGDQALPQWVIPVERKQGQRIHDFLSQAAIVITDLHSIVLDAAYLEKPLVYWQLDRNMPGEGNPHATDYYDYKKDGFGPVAENPEQTLDALESILCSGGIRDIKYTRRAQAAFAYHDDNNCERVFEAIAAL